MSTTRISDFRAGETKRFTITCKIDGVAQNITSDTVRFTMKSNRSDSDASAAIQKDADVATQGSSGVAIFTLTPTDTDVSPGSYFCDVQWIRSDGSEYVVYDGRISVLERVSDT